MPDKTRVTGPPTLTTAKEKAVPAGTVERVAGGR